MAATFNESQKIDYLWKKVGYGVTKTAEVTSKEAFNESIASPLLYRGDLVWMESDKITVTPPSATTSIVQVYKDGTGGFSPSVECTEDLTAPDNQTWKTNLTNWVPTQFGDNYLIQVYVANSGVTNPQTSGTKLFQAGSGSDDTWFFDYQSGVLNFNGTNIPTQITGGVTGKSIYIVGYRYVGLIGVTNQPSGNIASNTNIGNLNFTDTTISTVTTNSNIYLAPNGVGNVLISSSLITSGNITVAGTSNLGNVGNVIITGGTTGYLLITDGNGNLSWQAPASGSGIANGNSNVNIPNANGNINLTASGNTTLIVTDTGANVAGYLTVTGTLTAGNINSNVSSNTISANSITANSANISGNLYVADTATIGNVRTDHLLYANGQPWDLQEAAGANTQIQFNDGNTNFGASANLTFNYATNLLTVVGNINTSNANLGNLATANFANITGNLYVADTATIGNVRTDHILYANGQPWDLQEAAGANTQIQFNDGNTNFGASANFTFNTSTNLLTVIGNISASNADLGNLAIANFYKGAFDNTSSNQSNITTVGNLTFLNVDGIANLANVLNIEGNIQANANITAIANITGANLNTLGLANIGNLEISGKITGNLIPSANANSLGSGYNIGSSSDRWKDLYLSGNSVYIGEQTITANANGITLANTTYITDTVISGNATVNLAFTGNTGNFSGNVIMPNATVNLELTGNTANFSGNIIALNTDAGNLLFANFANISGNLITSNATINLELQANTANFDGNVQMDQWLTVADTANVGNLRTDHILYANGMPWDLQEAAGSNTEIQFNDGNTNFGASANFTFNTSTNLLTVIGNINTSNADLGNLATANYANITGNLYVADTANVGNLRTDHILYANGSPWDLQEAAGANTQIQYNDGNTNFGASANFTFDQTTNILTVVGNANVGNFNATGTINATGNISGGNIATIGEVVATGNGTFNNIATVGSGGNITGANVVSANTFTASANINANNANLGNLVTSNYANISANLYVFDTANVGNLRTDHLLYANGSPWDLQEAAGANTEIQFNDGNTNFGASANFTFNTSTNLLTVIGNTQFNNANLGNLATANYINVSYHLDGNTANFSGNLISGNANLGNTSIANNVVANTFRMGVGVNEFYHSTVYFATTTSTDPNQVLWSTAMANLSAIDFTIISTDETSNTRQTAKIAAAVLGTEVVFNEYSGLYINGGVGSFSVNYQAGPPETIQLVVTPDSTNLTKYNMMIIQYAK